ncbi:Galactose oxidase [Handroanthus impetiginosus]|uniref:Galactose oxidase n=1 Tax=Handroanthus impetiginosus TaxID=429701 RepID=A0A2G9HYB4_9LAMI|nr:Galactose oxidase [Handroanthus impetiginosus]
MDNKHLSSFYKLLATAYLVLLFAQAVKAAKAERGRGEWQLLLNNTGVVAMHMALTYENTVIMFDQTDSGPSRYLLRRRFNGTRCEGTQNDLEDSSCYAHSVEYDVLRNKIRPLDVGSDTWCSSGSMLSNGTLIETGGFGAGSRRIRYFSPCRNGHCDWKQGKKLLSHERWYASNLRLPEKDDRIIVVGGRDVFSYEFVPKTLSRENSFNLPFLHKTYDKNQGRNNLYPILHLSSDGNIFIFANRDSILFDYKRNKVVKTYPRIPGKGSRSYPSTGSSVILPLHHTNGFKKVEVMICGGAAYGAYSAAKQGRFLKGLSSCGRMVITGNNHKWKMEKMPESRLMNDMIILPTGHILIINGVKNGCAGWELASNPSLRPYLYKPKKPLGKRFSILKSTKIARMYHSSAVLLPDGRVLVGGSNPNNKYTFKNVAHPTELRLQAFVPAHMGREFDHIRPKNVSIYTSKNDEVVAYGEEFEMKFLMEKENKEKLRNEVIFTAYATPFNTHSISMNQRMIILKCKNIVRNEDGWFNALLEAPPSAKVAPSGYYMLNVVNNGIPSGAQWVRFVYA